MLGRKQFSKEEREIKQTEIMNSVEEMFLLQNPGDLNITMEKIAKKANLGKGTLYLYFSTKEELIFKCYIRSLHTKDELLDKYLVGIVDSYSRIVAFFDFYYDFFKKNPQYLNLQIMCENAHFKMNKIDSKLKSEYTQIALVTKQKIKLILQDCISEGIFRKDLNIDMTLTVLGRTLRDTIYFCLFIFELHALNLQNICTADEYFQNFVEILLKGMKV